jgi:hypothetical protein
MLCTNSGSEKIGSQDPTLVRKNRWTNAWVDRWIEKFRGQIDIYKDGQKDKWMDGWTDGQLGGKVGGRMGGWKDMLTPIYTGTTSLYLYIFVGLIMNQDESIFVPTSKKILFL